MVDQLISDIPAATTPLAGTELVELLTAGGDSKSCTVQDIADLGGGGSGSSGSMEWLITSGNINADAATHKNKMLNHTSGTITLEDFATSGFALNDEFVVRRAAGAVGFAAGSGVSLDYNSTLYDASSIFALKDCVAVKAGPTTDTYTLIGPLADAP